MEFQKFLNETNSCKVFPFHLLWFSAESGAKEEGGEEEEEEEGEEGEEDMEEGEGSQEGEEGEVTICPQYSCLHDAKISLQQCAVIFFLCTQSPVSAAAVLFYFIFFTSDSQLVLFDAIAYNCLRQQSYLFHACRMLMMCQTFNQRGK